VLRRRRSKNNNVPKSASPTTPPTTPPAIAPAFVALAAGGFVGTGGVGVGLTDVRPVSVVVGDKVDVGRAVDSGPPALYFRGLEQRGYKM
jgi:hypothetical protein